MTDRPIFGPDELRDQLRKVDEQPNNQAHAGVVAQNGDIGAEAEGKIDLGNRGGFVEGEASWFTRTGWRVAAAIGWRKKP
jgi:hypothetical protein